MYNVDFVEEIVFNKNVDFPQLFVKIIKNLDKP
jgi:hypothetical protein